MFHDTRHWCVSQVDSIDELVDKLGNYNWCCCSGFQLNNVLWLNDATGEDGAQEYAVVRLPTEEDPHYRQVESITVSWCKGTQLGDHVRAIHEGEPPPPTVAEGAVVVACSVSDMHTALGSEKALEGSIVTPILETPKEHGRCRHCA